jgi:hypothetical protein
LILVAVPRVGVRSASAESEAPEEPRWGVKSVLAFGEAGGDYEKTFEFPKGGEFELFHTSPSRFWRYGAGLSFSSFTMKPPHEEELEAALQQVYLHGSRIFRLGRAVRPYLEARLGLARFHARSELFKLDPLPPDFATGDSPTPAANGFALSAIPGVELSLTPSLALDLSAGLTYFKTSDYDLSAVGQAPAGSGTMLTGRFGVVWRPSDDSLDAPAERERDAWGVGRNYGWAAAEVLATNLVASGFNEYYRNANFNQISPRSWWHNLNEGFTYDDNEFRTNQLIHPFNGAAYFNGARANGLGYWTSAGYAMAGAFFWECCGETHPISLNDTIATGIGGAAVGEMQYRFSSMVLDNAATGRGRRWREIGAFLIDPIRGVDRLLSGRSSGSRANPTDALDWRPQHSTKLLAVGVRTIGQGDSISENTKSYPFLEFDYDFGSPFENDRGKPFDYFNAGLQMNFGEKVPIGRVQIQGNLLSRTLNDSRDHVLALVQHFDYVNNTAFEFGGQSFGPSLLSRFRLSDKLALRTRVDGLATLLGAVNTQAASIADVAEQERLREYDYGPGLGVAARATLAVSNHPVLQLSYRYQWISVTNGSVYTHGSFGSSSNHHVQAAALRVNAPLHRGLGIGVDGTLFLRDSNYSIAAFKDVHQRNPQARLYLSWSGVR